MEKSFVNVSIIEKELLYINRRIIALKYGESIYNEHFIFAGGNPKTMLPISFVFYLIQDGERNILIDVGCSDGGGFVMSCFCRPTEALKDYGISPEEITDVVITHHHYDHIESIGVYTNAVIHIQKDEYMLGKKYIPDGFQVQIFESEAILAEGLIVKKIGGHSAGSSIVICQSNDREYVFCGDECYVKACFERKIPTGSSCNPEISRQFIQEYGNGNYKLILFHDSDIMKGETGHKIIVE